MEEAKEAKIFPYSAVKQGYASNLIAFLVLILIEASLELLLITVLLPNGWLKWAIHLTHSTLCILVCYILIKGLLVLKTAHTLSHRYLKLHYGPDLKVSVPLEALESVWFLQNKVAPMSNIRPTFNEDKQRIVAAFSEKGQVLLKLNRLYPVRLGLFKKVQAREILINLDQRDDFLETLNRYQALSGPKTENRLLV